MLRVARAGVTLLVPRFGLEHFAYVTPAGAENPFELDEASATLRAPGCTLRMLDQARAPRPCPRPRDASLPASMP